MKHTILLILISFSLSAQRIKLFQLEQKGVTKLGYVGITNSNGDQVYGKLDSFIRKNADTSNTNEAQTWSNSGSFSWTGTLSSFGGVGGGTTTFQAAGIVSISHSSGTVTISATESDGNPTNEAQTWSNSGTTSYTGTLSNVSGVGGGSFSIVGAGGTTISHSGGTITITSSTGISGSGTTNFITKWTGTTSIGNSMLQDNGAELGIGTAPLTGYEVYVSAGSGVNTLTKIGNNAALGSGLSNRISFGDNSFCYIAEEGADDQLTLYTTSLSIRIGAFGTGGAGQVLTSNGSVATWVSPTDASATNEAQTWSNSGTTSYTGTLSNVSGVGGGSFSLIAGSNITLSHSGGNVTINSSSLPSLSFSTSGTYVTTISNVSGSFKWVAGSGISISNSGTGADAIMNISATGSSTDLSFSGGASPSLNSSTGTDVTFSGSGVSFFASGSNMSITATDASATNEAQTWSNSGTTSYTGTLSNVSGVGGGSFSIAGGTNITVSHSAGTVTISSSAGSQTLTNSGTSSFTSTLSNSGGSFTLSSGSGIDISRSGNTATISLGSSLTGLTNPVYYNSSTGFLTTDVNATDYVANQTVPNNVIVLTQSSPGSTTTLPTIATVGVGHIVYISNLSNANITISRGSTDLINGNTTAIIGSGKSAAFVASTSQIWVGIIGN